MKTRTLTLPVLVLFNTATAAASVNFDDFAHGLN